MNTFFSVVRPFVVLLLLAGCQSASEEVIPQNAQAHARGGYDDNKYDKKDKNCKGEKYYWDGYCHDCEVSYYYAGQGDWDKKTVCHHCTKEYYWNGDCHDCKMYEWDWKHDRCKKDWDYKRNKYK